MPNIPETYVHRIGRTGRAGLGGVALSFCDVEEKAFLKDIEKVISKQIPIIEDHPYPASNMKVIVTKDEVKKSSAGKPRSTVYARRNGRNQGGRKQSEITRATR